MEKDNRMVIDKDERLEFCSFEQSVELKKLGLILDSPFGYYNNDGELAIFGDEVFYDGTYAPLIQQAFRFLRKKYGLYASINKNMSMFTFYIECIDYYLTSCDFRTYEEAEQACLNKLIQIANESK